MVYKIFGMEVSPYSIKVRSYFRYKQIPHEWIIRSMDKMEEFLKYAKLPLVPTVIMPNNKGLQDSTPIIETLELDFVSPSIVPNDEALAFLSCLLEEYADEWVNKSMFHYRWSYPENIDSCALRIAKEQMGVNAKAEQVEGVSKMLKERMVGRLHVVGSSVQTAPIIEASFLNLLKLLEKHFASGRSYLFGAKPALADFGLYAQLYEHYTDPRSKKIMDEQAPLTRDWCLRMLNPKSEGEFESLNKLENTLRPIFTQELGSLFLPWAEANAQAAYKGKDDFSVELSGQMFTQKVAKYSVKSFAALLAKYKALQNKEAVQNFLSGTACLTYLKDSD